MTPLSALFRPNPLRDPQSRSTPGVMRALNLLGWAVLAAILPPTPAGAQSGPVVDPGLYAGMDYRNGGPVPGRHGSRP